MANFFKFFLDIEKIYQVLSTSGDIMMHVGDEGCSVHRGDTISTSGDTMSTSGDIMSTLGDIMSTSGDVQYIRGIS